MADPVPDPNSPQPTPGNPNPEPARPPPPPETPPPDTPPGVPPPTPDPIPAPEEEPVQIPPGTPPEIPSQPGFPAPTASVRPFRQIGTGILAVALLSLVGSPYPVAAQTPENDDEPKALERCRAEPEEQAEEKEEEQSNEDQRTSEILERCNGVLLPPPTGDREIEEPPADSGTTPVIPPGAVPQQPPE